MVSLKKVPYGSDALNDCLMNEMCLQKLERMVQKKENGNTVDDYLPYDDKLQSKKDYEYYGIFGCGCFKHAYKPDYQATNDSGFLTIGLYLYIG